MTEKRREIASEIKAYGHVTGLVEYLDGTTQLLEFPNTILRKGREALAASLANEVGDSYSFYVSRMLFGDGGTAGGAVKFVNSERNGLFGITRATKPVIASIDPDIPSQVIFTSVLARSEANGSVLNEMALQMSTGDLYSMITFADLSKTDRMQITFNWRLSFI